jgi:hypothetical protein
MNMHKNAPADAAWSRKSSTTGGERADAEVVSEAAASAAGLIFSRREKKIRLARRSVIAVLRQRNLSHPGRSSNVPSPVDRRRPMLSSGSRCRNAFLQGLVPTNASRAALTRPVACPLSSPCCQHMPAPNASRGR